MGRYRSKGTTRSCETALSATNDTRLNRTALSRQNLAHSHGRGAILQRRFIRTTKVHLSSCNSMIRDGAHSYRVSILGFEAVTLAGLARAVRSSLGVWLDHVVRYLLALGVSIMGYDTDPESAARLAEYDAGHVQQLVHEARSQSIRGDSFDLNGSLIHGRFDSNQRFTGVIGLDRLYRRTGGTQTRF